MAKAKTIIIHLAEMPWVDTAKRYVQIPPEIMGPAVSLAAELGASVQFVFPEPVPDVRGICGQIPVERPPGTATFIVTSLG